MIKSLFINEELQLIEVKQHKYKVVLGWVTIWRVVLLIRCRKACYDHNINQEPNAGGDTKQLCKQWFIRLTSGHNLVFLRLLLGTALAVGHVFALLYSFHARFCSRIIWKIVGKNHSQPIKITTNM